MKSEEAFVKKTKYALIQDGQLYQFRLNKKSVLKALGQKKAIIGSLVESLMIRSNAAQCKGLQVHLKIISNRYGYFSSCLLIYQVFCFYYYIRRQLFYSSTL